MVLVESGFVWAVHLKGCSCIKSREMPITSRVLSCPLTGINTNIANKQKTNKQADAGNRNCVSLILIKTLVSELAVVYANKQIHKQTDDIG